jgi:hypothetical protein
MITPFLSRKLTKKLLMGLPDTLFLVSNVMRTPTESIFAETIRPGPDRLALSSTGTFPSMTPSPSQLERRISSYAQTEGSSRVL